MGYELHIIRRNDWEADEEKSNITLAEWLDYVKTDGELELTSGYSYKIGQDTYHHDCPGFCEWNAYSKEQRPGHRPWFSHDYGCISIKYPDTETIRKMIAMAEALDARVQGDDGEFYDEAAVVAMEAADAARKTPTIEKQPWWKFW